jgi:integrase
MAKKKKGWSYNAGEKGRNWVRAYEDRPGKFYLEYFEEELQPGKVVRKRRRTLLRGVADAMEAKRRADKLAAKFTELEPPPTAEVTLSRLLTRYIKEVTPTKSKSKQGHDRRAARMFARMFGAKKPRELDRSDWDRFVRLRRTGEITGFKAVKNRQVAYDLKFLIAVLTWGTGVQENGRPILEYNPWSAERRKSRSMVMPKEADPKRPEITDSIRSALIAHSPHWQFSLALVLGRYTASRNSSVRQLRWSDVELESRTVRWRGENDKNGRDVVVPLLNEAVEALKSAPRPAGSEWVFPSEKDASQPTPRDTFQTWMRRAKKRAGINIRGLGFHGEKRAAVRDPWFRSLDPKMKETIARTNHRTLVDVYDAVGVDEMREAIRRRHA